MKNLKVGFIGQGMVGKNMADDFEARGYETIRYSLEPEYIGNKDRVCEADIVFIAVPTPTTWEGFNDSILRSEIGLTGVGKIAVIKSTILPGTTESIQNENPAIYILHSPEFLVASRAAEGVSNPERNLIGLPFDNDVYRKKAEMVLSVLPKAPYEKILLSKETELIKYVGNNFLYTKVIFMNLMYELAKKNGSDWNNVAEAVSQDSRIGKSHMHPVHSSLEGKTTAGRGAGGFCFPKDFEAFLQFYKKNVSDKKGIEILESIRNKNLELLLQSGKDLDILKNIYSNLN